jgi:hypothetical protein
MDKLNHFIIEPHPTSSSKLKLIENEKEKVLKITKF